MNSRSWWHPIRNNKQRNDTDSSSKQEKNKEKIEEPNLIWEMYRNKSLYSLGLNSNTVLNHLENNTILSSKRGLFFSLLNFYTNKKQNNENIEDNIHNLDENIVKNNKFCLDNLYNIIPKTYYLSPKDKINDKDQLNNLMKFCDDHPSNNFFFLNFIFIFI